MSLFSVSCELYWVLLGFTEFYRVAPRCQVVVDVCVCVCGAGFGSATSTRRSRSWAACACSTSSRTSRRPSWASSTWPSRSSCSSNSKSEVRPPSSLSVSLRPLGRRVTDAGLVFRFLFVCLFVFWRPERNLNPKAACLKRREEEKADDGSSKMAPPHLGNPPPMIPFGSMPPSVRPPQQSSVPLSGRTHPIVERPSCKTLLIGRASIL